MIERTLARLRSLASRMWPATRPRTRSRTRPILLGAAGLLLGPALVAEGIAGDTVLTALLQIAAGALALGALAAPVHRVMPWAIAAVTLSCAVSLTLAQLPRYQPDNTPGLVETGALFLLAVRALRLPSLLRGAALACGAGLAIAMAPFRVTGVDDTLLGFLETVLFFCFLLTVALGLYLRLLDTLRTREHAAGLQAQRLAYARELHDFVAHHVTAIVAQTKAVRFTAAAGRGPEPAELDRMLADIEKAGAQALDSMRGMVSHLRTTGNGAGTAAPAPLAPAGALTGLRGLVEQFSATGPAAELTLDPRIGARTLPPAVTDTAFRVVREALTNVRRHAPEATAVTVDVRLLDESGTPDRLRLIVTNDGLSGATPAYERTGGRERTGDSERPVPAGGHERAGDDERGGSYERTGGYGLTGLTEHVTAAGGLFTAAPRDETSWQVTAELALPARSSAEDG